MIRSLSFLLVALLAGAGHAAAQTLSQRGFADSLVLWFPQNTSRDTTDATLDLLVREEVFLRPSRGVQVAAGLDLRANTHNQVERTWRVDFGDRHLLRPAVSVRRLSATFSRGPVTLDVGKQFIRWGKADIVTPTDHFAPRDFINVINSEFLAVAGARAVVQVRNETLDVAWVPRVTPSRLPLLDQRWTALPPEAEGFRLSVAASVLPSRDQVGVRWSHTASGFEFSTSVYDGLNHLPTLAALPTQSGELLVGRSYSRLRSYGADAAVPTRWFTLKGEVAYTTSPDKDADEFALYVVQFERQTGEWQLLAGYAGEIVTRRRLVLPFAPDRGLTRALVGRASYTIDAVRSVALETAVRQNARGVYVKGEYSQARGQHWRATLAGVAIGGRQDDFLGQYRRNSNVTLSLRYSY